MRCDQNFAVLYSPPILNSKMLDAATVHPPSSPTSAQPRELEWGQKLSWTIFEKGAKEGIGIGRTWDKREKISAKSGDLIQGKYSAPPSAPFRLLGRLSLLTPLTVDTQRKVAIVFMSEKE